MGKLGGSRGDEMRSEGVVRRGCLRSYRWRRLDLDGEAARVLLVRVAR